MNRLQSELNGIEQALTAQAILVEEMVALAHRGLQERSVGIATEVFALEQRLDASEIKIEEQCHTVLALHQPVANDLRRVAAALKINSDLERIGDLALNLAERTESLVHHPTATIPAKLDVMVSKALAMVRDADRAFSNGDVTLAQEVCQRDDEVDQLNVELIADVSDLIKASPNDIDGYLHVFSAVRIVERIADHATNIADDVIYLVQGEITRHNESLK